MIDNCYDLFSGAFDDPDVTHVEGEVDPVRDLDIISEELRLKDEENLLKALDKMERTVIRANDKKAKPEYVSCLVVHQIEGSKCLPFLVCTTNRIH